MTEPTSRKTTDVVALVVMLVGLAAADIGAWMLGTGPGLIFSGLAIFAVGAALGFTRGG